MEREIQQQRSVVKVFTDTATRAQTLGLKIKVLTKPKAQSGWEKIFVLGVAYAH